MKQINAIKQKLYAFCYESKNFLFDYLPSFIKSRTKLFWFGLGKIKNEFHSFFSMDIDFIWTASEKRREKYIERMSLRRSVAHKREMEE